MAQGSVAAWVDATMAESPDLIVLTGDYVDTYNQRPLEPLITELARLRAPLGVLAVWGNHDYVNRGWHAYLERAFAGIGVRVLRNSGVGVRPDLYVGGLDDWNLGRPHARRPGAPAVRRRDDHEQPLRPDLRRRLGRGRRGAGVRVARARRHDAAGAAAVSARAERLRAFPYWLILVERSRRLEIVLR